MEQAKLRKIKLCIAITVILMVLVVVAIKMLKYEIEGETKMPFNVSKITIVSSAQGVSDNQNSDVYDMKIYQTNDFYFNIDKNDEVKKDEVISKIIIDNIQYLNCKNSSDLKVYMPNSSNGTVFDISDRFLVKDKLEFKGSSKTDLRNLEIGNQGGLISVRFLNSNLGTVSVNASDEIKQDGTLIGLLDENLDDLKYTASFDLTIYVGNVGYKTTVVEDLPIDKIVEFGNASTVVDGSQLVFKRIK